MAWYNDWTESLWTGMLDVFKAPIESVMAHWAAMGERDLPSGSGPKYLDRARKAGLGSSPTSVLFRLIGTLANIMGHVKVLGEPDLQRSRMVALKEMADYPPDPDTVASLIHGGDDHKDYVAHMGDLQGKFPSTIGAYYELARTRPDFAALRELYNRGMVTEDYVVEVLKESGFRDQIVKFVRKGPTEEWDKFKLDFPDRPDRANLIALFKRIPGISDVITMEVRDTFPQSPQVLAQVAPPDVTFDAWANRYGGTPKTDAWEPGGEVPLTEALKEDSKFGPQSWASTFLGARRYFTTTFEKAAKAAGYDPYWAMKVWESHWVLPGSALLREMLFRSPKIGVKEAEQILRWQDFPPAIVPDIVRTLFRPLTRVDVRRMHLRGVLSTARVFRSYLDFGYNADNALRMTAFTVVYNMESLMGGTIKEVIKSFTEGALTRDEAGNTIWQLVGSTMPPELPEWASSEFSPEEIEGLQNTYQAITAQKQSWISLQLDIAGAERAFKVQRGYLATAKKQYTGWAWTEGETSLYLAHKGFSSQRAKALIEEWLPDRERQERMPTAAMLEDFLVEQNMPVELWRDYMRRIGYGDATIASILEGVGRLPTLGMLQGFLRAKIITVETFRTQAHKLGFDNTTIGKLVDMIILEAKESE